MRINTLQNFYEVNKRVSKSYLSVLPHLKCKTQILAGTTRTLIDQKTQGSTDSIIGESTQISERTTIKKSLIGRHCIIGKMVKINSCILLDHCVIEDG
jgi:translation initiation factor eIF-2B subunit gamma